MDVLGAKILGEKKSLSDLDDQLIANIRIFFVSFCTILSNLGVIFGLYKGRKVKFATHHYKLIIHMSAAACFQAFFIFLAVGAIQLIDTAFRIPANIMVKNCGLLLLLFEISLIIDAYYVLALAIDRLTAVFIPFGYRAIQETKEYKILTLASPWVLGIIAGCYE